MNRLLLMMVLPFIGGNIIAQVGVNTQTPTSTLDVTGKFGNTDLDGFQAPRLTRLQLTAKGDALYGTSQQGALVFITDVTGGDANAPQRTNVTAVGYYYFDGTAWVALRAGSASTTNTITNPVNTITSVVNGVSANAPAVNTVGNVVTGNDLVTSVNGVESTAVAVPNIYTNDGTLAGDRVVTEGDKTLSFTGTAVGANKFINTDGTAASQASPIQIKDGGEGLGKILTSDDSGNGTWSTFTIPILYGTMVSRASAVDVYPARLRGTVGANAINLGSYIKLPPGKWLVSASVLLYPNPTLQAFTGAWAWSRFTFSEGATAAAATASSNVTRTGDFVGNSLISTSYYSPENTGNFVQSKFVYSVLNGSIIIENKTTSDKFYGLLYWSSETNFTDPTNTYFFNEVSTSGNAENTITAMKIN